MSADKAFTRFRRAVGVDDTRPGLKRSLVNFHSFRRFLNEQVFRKAIARWLATSDLG